MVSDFTCLSEIRCSSGEKGILQGITVCLVSAVLSTM